MAILRTEVFLSKTDAFSVKVRYELSVDGLMQKPFVHRFLREPKPCSHFTRSSNTSDKNATDLGIDLVLEMHDGEFWTVQCKFYQKDTRGDEDMVSHFLGHQGWKFGGGAITVGPSPKKTFSTTCA